MKYLLLIPFFVILSCDDDGTKASVVDFEEFTISVPENWKYVEQQGYDSKVAMFVTIRGEEISYDLGLYSDSLRVDADTHYVSLKTIDNKDAKVVEPKSSAHGRTGVYFKNIGDGNRFQMSGLNLSAPTQATLLSAIETLHFK